MQARWDEGQSWLDACLPHWVNTNNFTIISTGTKPSCWSIAAAEAALELYDECLVALKDSSYLDVCNASACFTDWKCAGLI